jgi:hypothetical protein
MSGKQTKNVEYSESSCINGNRSRYTSSPQEQGVTVALVLEGVDARVVVAAVEVEAAGVAPEHAPKDKAIDDLVLRETFSTTWQFFQKTNTNPV